MVIMVANDERSNLQNKIPYRFMYSKMYFALPVKPSTEVYQPPDDHCT